MTAPKLPPESTLELVGLRGHADDSMVDHLHLLAKRSLRKLEAEFPASHLAIHYKVYKAKTEAGHSKFSLTAHLTTDRDKLVAKHHDWDVLGATEAILKEIERRAADHKRSRLSNRRDHRRTPARTSDL